MTAAEPSGSNTAAVPVLPGRSGLVRRLFRHPGFVIGSAIVALVVMAAAISLVWTPYAIDGVNISGRFAKASAAHWLGTDQLGRDVVSMLMSGAVTSLTVGFVAVGIGAGVGIPLGALAAVRPGLISEAIMRLGDLTFAFPAILTAVMITALWGPGAVNAILAIAIFNIPVFARLTRGVALGVWSLEYVQAARAAGLHPARITVKHVLPNVASVLIVQATIQFALAVLAEAGLSYLGLGAQPPSASWGRMLNEAQTLLYLAPQLAIYPGVAIAMTVLGLNLLGDGLRDVLDPRLRGR